MYGVQKYVGDFKYKNWIYIKRESCVYAPLR